MSATPTLIDMGIFIDPASDDRMTCRGRLLCAPDGLSTLEGDDSRRWHVHA